MEIKENKEKVLKIIKSRVKMNVYTEQSMAVFEDSAGCLFSSVQFISITQSCPTLCHPMNHSMPGLPVHHQLLEFIQIRVH